MRDGILQYTQKVTPPANTAEEERKADIARKKAEEEAKFNQRSV